MPIDRRRFGFLAAGLIAAPTLTRAQAFPSRPVRLIVPFPPGGTTDLLGRALAEGWSRLWGVEVAVENRAGAGSNLGSAMAARADADGYTILIAATVATINPHIYRKIDYDLFADLAPVTLCIRLPNVMTVPNNSPARDVAEFVAHARANPGKLTFASTGTGTAVHLAGELFRRRAGIEMTHVPYRGSAPAFEDLVAGRADVMFDNATFILPRIRAGQVRGLAVTSRERAPGAADMPTLIEAGFADFEATSWFGVVVPARTPSAIVAKLNADAARVLNASETVARFERLGTRVATTTPEAFGAFMRTEHERWGRLARETGVKLEG